MLTQDDELKQIKQIKQIKEGYAYAENWDALQRAYRDLCAAVTALAISAHSGRLEIPTSLDFGKSVAVGDATKPCSELGERPNAVDDWTMAGREQVIIGGGHTIGPVTEGGIEAEEGIGTHQSLTSEPGETSAVFGDGTGTRGVLGDRGVSGRVHMTEPVAWEALHSGGRRADQSTDGEASCPI